MCLVATQAHIRVPENKSRPAYHLIAFSSFAGKMTLQWLQNRVWIVKIAIKPFFPTSEKYRQCRLAQKGFQYIMQKNFVAGKTF